MKKSAISHFLIALSLIFLTVSETLGGELTDEFDSPKLNEELWVIKELSEKAQRR